MGSLYEFNCPICNFHTECSKGVDRGFKIKVEPMFCTNCKTLKNIHIGNYFEDKFDETQIQLIERICKDCLTGKYLISWNKMGCPCCGHFLMLSKDTYITWD